MNIGDRIYCNAEQYKIISKIHDAQLPSELYIVVDKEGVLKLFDSIRYCITNLGMC